MCRQGFGEEVWQGLCTPNMGLLGRSECSGKLPCNGRARRVHTHVVGNRQSGDGRPAQPPGRRRGFCTGTLCRDRRKSVSRALQAPNSGNSGHSQPRSAGCGRWLRVASSGACPCGAARANSAAGNCTRVFRVTGGNTNHYTTTDGCLDFCLHP